MSNVLLGVNIDHIATIRNARGTNYPDPLDAIPLLVEGGADGVTIHLREDRRHIIDQDVERICSAGLLPVNLEMAATTEMLAIAIANQPKEVCIVPEKREELTTEGGLDVLSQKRYLTDYIANLHEKNILVSLFVDPDLEQIKASVDCGADIVELHTGKYAELPLESQSWKQELLRITEAAKLAHNHDLVVNAGHGLTVENTAQIAQIEFMNCLNIGHSIVARSVFVGIKNAVKEIKQILSSV